MKKYLVLAALLFSAPCFAQEATVIRPAVQGPSSATSGNIATFNGTSGQIIQDGGVAATTVGAWTTYNGVVTAGSGTFTTVTAAGRYEQISSGSAKIVTYTFTITVTNAGTGSVPSIALPVNVGASANPTPIFCIETAATGLLWSGTMGTGASSVALRNYLNSGTVVNGYVLTCSGTYESA